MTYSQSLCVAFVGALTIATPTLTSAQGQRPPGPDFAAIGAELNLSANAVQACFPQPEQDQRPTPGERPTGVDMIELTSCLQSANPNLTGAQIGAVLEDFEPEQPPRG